MNSTMTQGLLFLPASDAATLSEVCVTDAGEDIVPEAVDELPAVEAEDSSYCLRGTIESSGAASFRAARTRRLAFPPSEKKGTAVRPQLVAASISALSAAMLFGWDAHARSAPSSSDAFLGIGGLFESVSPDPLLLLAVNFVAITAAVSAFVYFLGDDLRHKLQRLKGRCLEANNNRWLLRAKSREDVAARFREIVENKQWEKLMSAFDLFGRSSRGSDEKRKWLQGRIVEHRRAIPSDVLASSFRAFEGGFTGDICDLMETLLERLPGGETGAVEQALEIGHDLFSDLHWLGLAKMLCDYDRQFPRRIPDRVWKCLPHGAIQEGFEGMIFGIIKNKDWTALLSILLIARCINGMSPEKKRWLQNSIAKLRQEVPLHLVAIAAPMWGGTIENTSLLFGTLLERRAWGRNASDEGHVEHVLRQSAQSFIPELNGLLAFQLQNYDRRNPGVIPSHIWKYVWAEDSAQERPSAAAGVRAAGAGAKDYFSVLGLAPRWEVTDGELRRAMRSLVIKLHPDKNEAADKERCTAMFRGVMEAYEFLKNPGRRQQYLRDLGIPEPVKKNDKKAR